LKVTFVNKVSSSVKEAKKLCRSAQTANLQIIKMICVDVTMLSQE